MRTIEKSCPRVYSPRNLIAPPERKIARPARACEYRSSLRNGSFESPRNEAQTMASMVPMVVRPNIEATSATVHMLPLAAGYMMSGISGSQGPNTNIVKRIHGVKETVFEL